MPGLSPKCALSHSIIVMAAVRLVIITGALWSLEMAVAASQWDSVSGNKVLFFPSLLCFSSSHLSGQLFLRYLGQLSCSFRNPTPHLAHILYLPSSEFSQVTVAEGLRLEVDLPYSEKKKM